MARYPEMAGKVALVTGGSSGIGLASAQAFADQGATVVVASRDEKRAQEALKTFPAGVKVSWIGCDASDGKSVEALVAGILRQHGRLDFAFNNGGSIDGEDIALIGDMSEESWRRTIDGYLTSVFLCLRHQIPAMLPAGRGVIVNMSSIYGLRGHAIPGGGAYAAAKHGVLGLTKAAALEYGKNGIRVCAVCPTFVKTPLTLAELKGDEQWAALDAMHPLGHCATPDDVAGMVAFLGSADAAMCTGNGYLVDGGFSTP